MSLPVGKDDLVAPRKALMGIRTACSWRVSSRRDRGDSRFCQGEAAEGLWYRITEAVRIEVFVGLQNESRPIPLTPHILVPRPVSELLSDVARRNRPDISGYAFARQNYSIHAT
jgi:hypothetical protein